MAPLSGCEEEVNGGSKRKVRAKKRRGAGWAPAAAAAFKQAAH